MVRLSGTACPLNCGKQNHSINLLSILLSTMELVLIFLLVAIFLFLFFISISVYCYYAFYDRRREREIQELKWQLDAATHARDHVHPKWSLVVKWVQLLKWIQNLVEGPGMSKVCNAPLVFF